MSSDLSKKPMVVIDLESGSFVANKTGHEFFNLIPNFLDGKYYGYCPPHDDLNIEKLGAKKGDLTIDGVLVVYTKKYHFTNDRVIVGFTDNATVYREPMVYPPLQRIIEEDGKLVDCSFTIQSDNMYNLEDYPNRFVIRISDYNTYMFRKQRFYKGKYPELDRKIIAYLEEYLLNNSDEDSILFQRLVQEVDVTEDEHLPGYSETCPDFTHIGGSRVVNKRPAISKRALMAAHFQCAVDPSHKTFLTGKGTPYMEGHHLIPCTLDNAKKIFEERKRNIDCVENIVCICPTCHRQVHFGSKKEKEAVLKVLYDHQIGKLRKAGLDLTYEELLSYYE